jgi:Ser/Thr protein kinase RdoA (MazF antagonist)
MDPDRCLEDMLSLSQEILDLDDDDCCDGRRLADLVIALDGWLGRGEGFLPVRWQKP